MLIIKNETEIKINILLIKISIQQLRQSSKDSTGSSDTDNSSSDDESLPNTTPILPSGNEPPPEKAQKETEAGAEISALVNYVQPIHFSSFENAESKYIRIVKMFKNN